MTVNKTIFLFFFIAGLGLLYQIIFNQNLSSKLIAIGFFFICIDQARMAVIDLKNFSIVEKYLENENLTNFYKLTIITIIIELFGFYLAAFSIGIGAIFVLLSQIYFNSLVTIELHTNQEIQVKQKNQQDKILMLIIDSLGLMLISLWLLNIYPLLISLILLIIVISYEIVKYLLLIDFNFNPKEFN